MRQMEQHPIVYFLTKKLSCLFAFKNATKTHFILTFEQEKWLFKSMIFKFKGSCTMEIYFGLDFLKLECISFVIDQINFKGS